MSEESDSSARDVDEVPAPTKESEASFVVRLAPIGGGGLSIQVVGAATAEPIESWLATLSPVPPPGDDAAALPWARGVGLALYAAAFPPPVLQRLEERRIERGDLPLPIAVEISDPALALLPWELLRNPETERFLALAEASPFSRRITPERSPPESAAPTGGTLRVVEITNDPASGVTRSLGEPERSTWSVSTIPARKRLAKPPHVLVMMGDAALETVPANTPLIVVTGGVDEAQRALSRGRAAIAVPNDLNPAARDRLLAELLTGLAAMEPVDVALVGARRAVATDFGLAGLDWAAPALVTMGSPAPVISRRITVVSQQVQKRTLNWVKETLSGTVTSVILFLVGLALFRLGLSSTTEFSISLFSPYALFQSFKGLVLELSTFQEYILLIVAVGLACVTAVVGLLHWRQRAKTTPSRPSFISRLIRPVSTRRAVTIVTAATLTVLGAYLYQQYLWRVSLPIDLDDLGLAVTRSAAAASLREDLVYSLRSEGSTRRIVVRELPVDFDVTDVDKARSLGRRIDAEAVLIYREATGAASGTPYVAYLVFTDPTIGFVVGASGTKGVAATPKLDDLVQYDNGLAVPMLQTRSVTDLVEAAAGIIAYEQGSMRQAIADLELALPDDPNAPHAGIVNFYLGLAYDGNVQSAPAGAALERAVTSFERRRDSGEALGSQDQLLLAKALLARGDVAFGVNDWDGAIAWSERALTLRDDLLKHADGLERPAEIHGVFARLYAQIAEANRQRGDSPAQIYWIDRARAELAMLGQSSAPADIVALTDQSAGKLLIGDCVGADAGFTAALRIDPTSADARINAGIVALLQDRPDLARSHWQRVLELRPNDITARRLLASEAILHAVADGTAEPAAFAEAERWFREILRIDPANLDAHEQIAALTEWRADAATVDLTAMLTGDQVTTAKSQVLWREDRDREQRVNDLLTLLIDQRRILATELGDGAIPALIALADAYHQRQSHLYWGLPVRLSANDAEATARADGNQSASDAAEVKRWTTPVLAEGSPASRLERLQAWNLLLDAYNEAWGWYGFPVYAKAVSPWPEGMLIDTEAELLRSEWQEATARALADAEIAPPSTADEAEATAGIFASASLVETFFGDQALADDYQARWQSLSRTALQLRATSTNLASAMCAEERERQAGATAAESGDMAEAMARYDAALAINPRHVPTLIALADLRAEQGDLAGAIEMAQLAAQTRPNDARAWGMLGTFRLVTGDAAGQAVAFEKFAALVGDLPPRQRMATIDAVVTRLQQALDADPALAPRLRDLLSRVVPLLDEMSPDGEASFQYPLLLSHLGALALTADDPTRAEALLRRAIDGDPHLPGAKTDLAIAMIARDEAGEREIIAAIAETRDPLWESITDADQRSLLGEMAGQIDRYGERFPNRQPRLETFAIAVQRAIRSAE